MTVIYAIIFFGVLIFVHELGHFIFAKASGIEVKEFSIGFGPAIFKFRRGFTVYKIGILPLGGYVRLVGETPDEESLPGSFQSKAPWVKMQLAFAGPLFNYLSAVLVFIALNIIGFYVYEPVVGELIKGYPAEQAGLKEGDKIIRIEGMKILSWEDIPVAVEKFKDKEMEVEVKRGTKNLIFKIRPLQEEVEYEGRKMTKFLIGIKPDPEMKRLVREGVFSGIYQGVIDSIKLTGSILGALWGMLKGAISVRDLRSPIFIFKVAGEAAKESKRRYLFLLAVISINLAILNLFPIPVLDGGLIIIAFFELIMRKRAPEGLVVALKITGILILFFIISIAVYNDVVDIILKK